MQQNMSASYPTEKRKRSTDVVQGVPTASKACEECSRRKAKCDLYQPVCSRCSTRNLTCVYSERRRPGPAKGAIVKSNKDRLRDNNSKSHLERLLLHQPGNNSEHLTQTKRTTFPSSQMFYNDQEAIQDYSGTSKSSALPSINGNDWEQILEACDREVVDQIVPMPGVSRQSLHTESPLSQVHGVPRSHQSIPVGYPGLQLQENLIKLYLSRVQQFFPVFPAFGSEKILGFLGQEGDQSILLDAICAISARYSDDPELLVDKQSHAGDFFANRAKARHLARVSSENFSSLDLDTIKTSLLLTIYELTRHPGVKSWRGVSETTRLAYEFGLDKLDSQTPRVHGDMTAEEREDRRYVWWSIWKLDAFYGSMSSKAFSIDTKKIETLLPSVPLEEFIASGVATTKPRRPMPRDLSRAWKHALGLEIGDCQELYYITNAFIREAATLRRLQLSQQDVNQQLFLLGNALSSFRIALPEALQGDCLPPTAQSENLARQRVKAETLLLYHHTCIVLYLPNRNDNPAVRMSGSSPPDKITQPFQSQWPKCLRAACSVREILRDLPPVLISSLSPTASSGLWYAGLILTLQALTTEDEYERQRMCSEIDIVLAVLGRMAKYWDIAGAFCDTLESLVASSANVRSLTDIRHLLKEWNGPYIGNQVVSPALGSLTVVPPESSGIDEMGTEGDNHFHDSNINGSEFENQQSKGRGEVTIGNDFYWLYDDVVMCFDAFSQSLDYEADVPNLGF